MTCGTSTSARAVGPKCPQIALSPHAELPYPVASVERLQSIVKQAFTKRRKTLRNALAGVVPDAALEDLGIDAGLRPENLSLEDYTRLANWRA